MHRRISPGLRGPGALYVVVLTVLLWVGVATPALAYPRPEEPFSSFTCDQCHATAGEDSPWDGSGPHAGYASTTNKCVLCHSVHNAPATSVLLLRGPTVSQTCLLCHDGTGSGEGPYHSITAYGGSVQADHAYESTAIIPGGSENLDAVLSCADCHSVHGSNTVTPFIRDSTRAQVPADSGALISSDCLLRNNLRGDPVGTYPDYGAQWCAACHDQRHSQSTVINHPVNTSYTFGYGDVISHVPWTLTTRAANYDPVLELAISLGQTNSGYIMGPVPESGDGAVREIDRTDPICQQCHEDARDVEVPFSADAYSPNTPPYTNPAFLTFPHQTTNATLLVETDDDLCLNCHLLSTLP